MSTILIVDDDADLRSTLERLFQLNGFEVHTAANGLEALDRLARSEIHLLVTDLVMPDMDGARLIVEARARYPKLRIIAISGGAGQIPANSYLKVAARHGADAVVPKPMDVLDFVNFARRLLATEQDQPSSGGK